jgi:hypothetical protein
MNDDIITLFYIQYVRPTFVVDILCKTAINVAQFKSRVGSRAVASVPGKKYETIFAQVFTNMESSRGVTSLECDAAHESTKYTIDTYIYIIFLLDKKLST